MSIARIWKTGVDPERALEYEHFARHVSLPMFQAQQGFEGVFMLRDGADCTVITLWNSPADAAALSNSTTYKATVQRILDRGFLVGEQTLQTCEIHLSWLSSGK
jgi:heme-degrading monooxygenase HmoA